jgi:FecR protein/Glucodextranase, domain B
MTRRVLAFGLICAVLLLGGWLAVSRIIAPPAPAPNKPDAGVEVTNPVDPSRTDAAAVRQETPAVTVATVRGKVERRKATEPWRRARAGDNLGDQEFVRTGPGGKAELSVGQRSRLTIDRASEVSVRELTDVTHRFRLEQGRISVNYRRDGKRVLQIESKDGKAVARTQEASFSVLQTDDAVAVATETGRVDLSAAGKTVKVEQGKQSVVPRDAAPAAPAEIPKAVLLKVARARLPSRTNRKETTLRGQTQPGNRVLVAGKAASVDAQGRFSIKVPLKSGGNRIVVVTQDPSGRRKERVLKYFAVRSGARVDNLKVDWAKRPKLDVTWGKRPK